MKGLKTFLLLSTIFLTKICEGQSATLNDTSFTGRFAKYVANQLHTYEGSFINNGVPYRGYLDTMCFPSEVIRKVLVAANEGREYQKQVGLLTERLSLKDEIISQMIHRDSLIKAGYENQIAILKQELDLRKDQMNGYERLLKKERRKRRAATAAGVTVAGVLTYLLITK